MGDSETDNFKQKLTGQRISAREKKPVNYSSMNHGTGDVNG